jgi:hypothetical protein
MAWVWMMAGFIIENGVCCDGYGYYSGEENAGPLRQRSGRAFDSAEERFAPDERGRLRIVVSHPCAGKKAQGWGTGLWWSGQLGFISGHNSTARVRKLRMTDLWFLTILRGFM